MNVVVHSKWANRVLDILMWGSWLMTVIWSIAKMFGFINTPEWLRTFPVYGFGIAIGTILIKAGAHVEKANWLEKSFNKTDGKMNKLENRMNKFETRMDRIETKLDTGFKQANNNFQKLIAKIDG